MEDKTTNKNEEYSHMTIRFLNSTNAKAYHLIRPNPNKFFAFTENWKADQDGEGAVDRTIIRRIDDSSNVEWFFVEWTVSRKFFVEKSLVEGSLVEWHFVENFFVENY
jgi:hypothetical protein